MERHIGNLADPVMQRSAGRVVFHDMPEGLLADFLMVEVQEQRRGAVGDADFEDRLGGVCHARPHAGSFENAPRAISDCRSAAIIGGSQHGPRILPVDDGNRQPGPAQGSRQRQPDQSTANDQDIGLRASNIGLGLSASVAASLRYLRHGHDHARAGAACPALGMRPMAAFVRIRAALPNISAKLEVTLRFAHYLSTVSPLWPVGQARAGG